MLSEQSQNEIDREIAKYPPEQKQAAVMAALRIAQSERGWLSEEIIDYVADRLEIPSIRAAEVATFYSMYDLQPVGRHKISLCTNISCMLRGSDTIVKHLQDRLDIRMGETTKDGKFTLKEVECLAACGGAPMMQVDDEYFENLTPERVDEILAELE
ncbi:MAG: NADH-quinone oxidoreductase subunit NuoE [Arenicellales bacterium]|nr:NADH-quinone oxidoreductase subunit NuoE [Arenicellales bacterium]